MNKYNVSHGQNLLHQQLMLLHRNMSDINCWCINNRKMKIKKNS